MEATDYWGMMRGISRRTGQLMCQPPLPQALLTGIGTCPTCTRMVTRRSQELMLRAGLVAFAYRAAGGTDLTQLLPLAVAVELLMCKLYLMNQVVDRKGEVGSGSTTEVLHRDILEPVAEELVGELLGSYGRQLLFWARDRTYEGLWWDQHKLNWAALDTPLEELEAMYVERCRLLDGELIASFLKMAAIVANGSGAVIDAVWQYGQHFGIALQIVNDISDFVPSNLTQDSAHKYARDAGADVRNGRLTIPIIYGWYRGSSSCRDLIGSYRRGSCRPEMFVQLRDLLLGEGHIWAARQLARRYGRLARNALHIPELPKDRRRDLSTACVMMDANRFYHALRSLK